MEELIQKVADRAGIDPDLARQASAIILNFVNREGPPEDVRTLYEKIPGAESILDAPPGAGGGGGGLSGMLGGNLMGVYNELTGIGLGMGQIQDLTRAFVEFGREKAGEDVIGRIVGGIPGLGQFV